MMADAPKPDKGESKMVRATVAPRRSVIPERGGRAQGPGSEVTLTPAEAARLKGLGFLVDASIAPVVAGQGPVFDGARPIVTTPA